MRFTMPAFKCWIYCHVCLSSKQGLRMAVSVLVLLTTLTDWLEQTQQLCLHRLDE